MLNGIILIVLCVTDKAIASKGFQIFQAFCEYCETILPLVLGVYLIYIIQAIGFVSDEEEGSELSRSTNEQSIKNY